MTNLILSIWLVLATNAGVVTTNLVLEYAPQRVIVPLGALLSAGAVTNIARAEVANTLKQVTNSVIALHGSNITFTLLPKP